MLRVLDNGKLIAAFPVTVGSERLPAPKGSWKVKVIASLPDFRWDEKMLKEGERSDNAITLPPGPRNPVGVYWMGLNKEGIGVHGTDSPWTIGRSASHGCIRLANWDAVKVAGMIAPGTPVEIR
jgi:lipoprotein-anchoring transpeptidase ErfK/SrfK